MNGKDTEQVLFSKEHFPPFPAEDDPSGPEVVLFVEWPVFSTWPRVQLQEV
jgi:hypothetical protein